MNKKVLTISIISILAVVMLGVLFGVMKKEVKAPVVEVESGVETETTTEEVIEYSDQSVSDVNRKILYNEYGYKVYYEEKGGIKYLIGEYNDSFFTIDKGESSLIYRFDDIDIINGNFITYNVVFDPEGEKKRIYNLNSGHTIYSGSVRAIKFKEDNKYFLTCTGQGAYLDYGVNIYNLDTGHEIFDAIKYIRDLYNFNEKFAMDGFFPSVDCSFNEDSVNVKLISWKKDNDEKPYFIEYNFNLYDGEIKIIDRNILPGDKLF